MESSGFAKSNYKQGARGNNINILKQSEQSDAEKIKLYIRQLVNLDPTAT